MRSPSSIDIHYIIALPIDASNLFSAHGIKERYLRSGGKFGEPFTPLYGFRIFLVVVFVNFV